MDEIPAAKAPAPKNPPQEFGLVFFAGGFVTFSLLYSVQPLLPSFARDFRLEPAAASLSLSVTTAALASGMLATAPLSEVYGRTRVMKTALLFSSLLGILVPLCTSFRSLLVVRSLLGLALAGLPAVAMAYLSEEVSPSRAGSAIGLFISGNAIGGMSGRLLTGLLTDHFSWRTALFLLAALCFVASLWFASHLPPSRNFKPHPIDLGSWSAGLRDSLRDPGLLCLFAIALLLMGSFVALYNYIGFFLMGSPFRLTHSEVSFIFLVYLVGTVSSPISGRLADRLGRRRVLWAAVALQLMGAWLTLPPWIWVKVFGVAVFTAGFFAAHSAASSWVGLRAFQNNAAASALYLFFYYCGSSAGGWLGGLFWAREGWMGLVLMISVLLFAAIALSLRLKGIPPIQRVVPSPLPV